MFVFAIRALLIHQGLNVKAKSRYSKSSGTVKWISVEVFIKMIMQLFKLRKLKQLIWYFWIYSALDNRTLMTVVIMFWNLWKILSFRTKLKSQRRYVINYSFSLYSLIILILDHSSTLILTIFNFHYRSTFLNVNTTHTLMISLMPSRKSGVAILLQISSYKWYIILILIVINFLVCCI